MPAHPTLDYPILSVRWEGLVVIVDATTLNTAVRKVMQRVPDVQDVHIEPENGRLGLTLTLARKPIPVPLRSHLTSIRLKDGFLGFHVDELVAFGCVPIPSWLLKRIVNRQPRGAALFYPDSRVVVIDLNTFLPEELTLNVRDVICENSEVKFVFGPSRYRLDKLIDEIGKNPFEDD